MNLISIYILLFSRFVAGLIDSTEQLSDFSSSITNLDIDKIQSQARYDHRLLSKEIKSRIKINNNKLSNKLSKYKSDEIEQEYGASCYILSKEYYHGQQIKRKNNCEVCLCLDGEIFCWWKKCIFRKKKKFLKDILNSKKKFSKKIKFNELKKQLHESSLNKTAVNLELTTKHGIDLNTNTSSVNLKNNITATTPAISESKTESPVNNKQAKCIVMGVSYNIGDILPQDTGNCLQCECSENTDKNEDPRITCTPHNCPPLILPDLLDETEF